LDRSKRAGLESWFRYADDLGLGPYYRRRSAAEARSSNGESSREGSPEIQDPLRAAPNTPLTAVAKPAKMELPSLVPAQKSAPPPSLLRVPTAPSLFDERIEDDTLGRIREAIGGNCTRCKLHKARTKIVFGVGNPQAELVFVGEGPGRDEDAQGEPFVGRAGQLLTQMIEAMSLRREDVYIANVVKCRPPENRLPEKDEIEICSPFLMRQLSVIKPKVICALGSCAAQTLLQTTQGISRFRGEWFDFRGSKLMATYHPAYLLRNPSAKGEVWKDLQKVMAHLGLRARRK
jgi:uracil-DNA glycosylase family 4